MGEQKTISDAKLAANRKNALHSTGPKTKRGKRYSRRNALKHGLYSSELLASAEDQPEFGELRGELMSQYQPATTMQWLAFDNIHHCCWRCKLAARLESRHWACELTAHDDSRVQTIGADPDPHLLQWYGASRLNVRATIKMLELASAEFISLGYLKPETKESLSRLFGPGFVDELLHWTPMSNQAILAANAICAHVASFGGSLPYPVPDPSKVIVDPQQSLQMVTKLLSFQRRFLEEMLRIRDEKWADGESREAGTRRDFNPGLLAAANRELRCAVEWYVHLVELGL